MDRHGQQSGKGLVRRLAVLPGGVDLGDTLPPTPPRQGRTKTGTNEDSHVVENTAPSVACTAPDSLTVGIGGPHSRQAPRTQTHASSHSTSVARRAGDRSIDRCHQRYATTVNASPSMAVVMVTDSASGSATGPLTFPSATGTG